MDIKLPNHLIIKIIVFTENIYHFYLIQKSNDDILKRIKKLELLSFKPLIARNKKCIYYFKEIMKEDYEIISFCLQENITNEDFNNQILKNYFDKKSVIF